MHRLAGWLGHGGHEAALALEDMLAPCSVARPRHVLTDNGLGLAASLSVARRAAWWRPSAAVRSW